VILVITDLRRSRPREGKSLTEEQARKLLTAAKGERLELAINIGLQMGFRPGEVLGLTWDDIDLKNGVVTVHRSLKRERNKLLLGDVKTPTSRRSVAMPRSLVDMFQHQRVVQETERLAAGELWIDLSLVVATAVGTLVDPSNMRRDLLRVCETAGIGHWSPNQLRHSFASIVSSKGVNLEEIADAMGHVDTRMTSLVYRHRLNPVITTTAPPMEVLFGS
jgi:integrase